MATPTNRTTSTKTHTNPHTSTPNSVATKITPSIHPPPPPSSPTLSASASFSHHALSQRVDRYFAISARGSSVGTEVRSGVVSFATMAYILIVNAQILSKACTSGGGGGGGDGVGECMEFDSIVTATAITAAFGSAFCGIVGNLPFGLAAGMGSAKRSSYASCQYCLADAVTAHSLLCRLLVTG